MPGRFPIPDPSDSPIPRSCDSPIVRFPDSPVTDYRLVGSLSPASQVSARFL